MLRTPLFVPGAPVSAKRSCGRPLAQRSPPQFLTALRPRRVAGVPCSCSADGGGAANAPAPIIGADGKVAFSTPGVTGAFGVYDAEGALVYVGKSRDVATSLRRVLARRPSLSHGFVVREAGGGRAAITEAVESIVQSWKQVAPDVPITGLDGGTEQKLWESAVDVQSGHVVLDDGERQEIDRAELDELPKVLKRVSRRVQGEIEAELKSRGLNEKLKFAPKLKEKGLIDVESVKKKVPDTIGASTVLTDVE